MAPIEMARLDRVAPVSRSSSRCPSRRLGAGVAREQAASLDPVVAPLRTARVAEGSYGRGKNRPARYHTASGSLREALACFEVAAALGYLPEVEPALRARFDHVLGALVRLIGGHP
jgi:hypothetical protein